MSLAMVHPESTIFSCFLDYTMHTLKLGLIEGFIKFRY